MSIAAETNTDFSDDIEVPQGTDLTYSFAVQPLDATGCTAQLITSFGTFSVSITVDVEGDQSITTFATGIPNASLPVPGVYSWKILVTWPFSPAPFVLQYGHGAIYIKAL